MAKCANCENEAVGRSKYCSNKCKVAWNRNKRNTESVTNVTVRPESVTVKPTVTQGQVVKIIEGETVYGRQAVRWPVSEAWDTRPELLDFNDQPKPGNRGKYIRVDGSEYIFDACGKVFECTLIDGASLVYPTMADLKQAQRARREAS